MLYHAAGWRGIIPIGRGPQQKSPPPRGYTGYAGLDPSVPDIYAWAEQAEGTYNIGLHLPIGVYVLDIDQRNGGGAGLFEVEARAGMAFPPTISNTSHGRNSGTRHLFYRADLPPGRVWRDHPADGLDSLHVGHRYAMVAPSLHPNGNECRWYGADLSPLTAPPSPGDLTVLPAALIEACSQPGEPLEGNAAGDAETIDVLKLFRGGEPCPRVVKLLHLELARMALADQQALHSPGPLYALTSYGIEGHAGVAHALAMHQAAHIDARTGIRGEPSSSAAAEWWRMVRGAVGKRLAASGGAIASSCECGRFGGEVIPLDPDPPELDEPPVHSFVRTLAGLPDDQLISHREHLKATQNLTFGTFDTIVKAERQRLAALAAAESGGATIAAQDGGELPHRDAPLPVARALHAQWAAAGAHLRYWRGDWYRHAGTHWQADEDDSIVRSTVYASTAECWFQDSERGPLPWNPDSSTVSRTLDAMAHGPAYRSSALPEDSCIATASGVLDPTTRTLSPHTTARFNLWSLPYAYDPAAACPQWLSFLDQQVPDLESQRLLQQWAGYLISGRTDLEKLLHLYGVRRGGKGTVATVMEGLVGARNTASVTLTGLTGQFGEQPLIGKSLAMITDASWKVREVETAVEAIKAIVGRDPRDVNRKGVVTWKGRLACRFLIVGNNMPEFKDSSGALLGRMIHIYFGRSVYGREDPGLKDRLLLELSGILNWALDGLDDLNAAGSLIVPGASKESEAEISRSTSPVAGFVADCLTTMDPALGTLGEWMDDLYAAYLTWCRAEGRSTPLVKSQLAKELSSALGIRPKRQRPGDKFSHPRSIFHGVALLPPRDPFALAPADLDASGASG